MRLRVPLLCLTLLWTAAAAEDTAPITAAPAAAVTPYLAEPEEQDTVEDYTDETTEKESLEIPSVGISTAAAVLDSRAAARIAVKEAELLFKEAKNSDDHGNSARSAELYDAALKRLASAGLEAADYRTLAPHLQSLFSGFDQYFSQAAAGAQSSTDTFTISMDTQNEIVKKYLRLYTQKNAKAVLNRALERSGKYRDMIVPILKEYDLPEELVYLPIVESLYNNNDRSRAGALGIWQLMPARARALGLRVNHWIDERKDPEKATRAAAQYLKELYIMFNDWHLALAAYNRGEFGLARDLQFSRATTIQQIADRNAVPKETELYVPKFIACALIARNYQDYGLTPAFEKPVAYDTVTTDKNIDIAVIAKCVNSTPEVIRELNPALKAWCTPYNYPGFIIRIPPGTRQTFLANIAQEKELNPSQGYIKYRIEKGDNLGKIARKFGTSAATIQRDNAISNPRSLKIGKVLLIRSGRKAKK